MTKSEIEKIKNVSADDVKSLFEIDDYKETAEYLTCDFENLTIQGNACCAALLKVYFLALKNATEHTVLSFLCSIDDTEMLIELTSGVFLDIAAGQKKKGTFEKAINRELKKRKEAEKTAKKEQRLLDRKAFLAAQPSYYGEKLTQETIQKIIGEEGITVKLNLATKKTELFGAKTIFEQYSKDNIMSTFPTLLLDICKNNEVGEGKISKSAIEAYLFNLADANRFNPIQEMLIKHENTDETHIETIYKILGITADYDKTLVKKWLIQTVAFAFASIDNPVSTEGVLVLQGEQGNGKTSFFRKLAGEPQYFAEGVVIDMRNKDSIITAISCWICELGEIDSTLKKEQSALKAFITREVDRVRLPYAAVESEIPRTTSLCGTVNPEQFLKDTTGNRRYWTIHVDNIDKHALHALTKEDVFNIWGYVYHLYLQDKSGFRLNDVELKRLEIKNRVFSTSLTYEEEIRMLLDFTIKKELWEWVSASELLPYIGNGAKSENVGRVLSRIQKEEPGIEKRRCSIGNQYLIPLKKEYSSRNSNYISVC